MKDNRGLYYYPFPYNKRVRMYVRKKAGEVCFRLWNTDEPQLWEQHGWVPYDAVKQASAMFDKQSDFDPNAAYDLEIAAALIREGK
jgi:hypothetical protein